MYYIITSSKEIYDFAKRKGAKVLSINQPVVIETGELSKVIDVESDIVDEFLSNFPNIDMTSLGARCLKYILANNMEVKGDLRDTVYPKVAEYFETTVNIVTRAICCTHKKCMSKLLNDKARDFFSGHDCSMYYSPERSFEFIRLCKKFFYNNYLKGQITIKASIIEDFFEKFAYVNKNTLGYKCVKYILENGIECSGDYEKTIYPILTKQFKTKVLSAEIGSTRLSFAGEEEMLKFLNIT